MSEVEWAQKVYREVATEYFTATADYEGAHMASGGAPDAETRQHYRVATDAYAEALQALVRARKEQVPSFESLLSDPTVQVDPDARVLASIRRFAAAEPASAGAPLRNFHLYPGPDSSAARVRALPVRPDTSVESTGDSATGSGRRLRAAG